MAAITKLAAELIEQILSFADPSDHVAFALSCKHLAYHSRRTLLHHRACHARFKASSDIQPSTLPALLRDPVAAWHVRSLEFWGMRSTWADWQRPLPLREDWNASGPTAPERPDQDPPDGGYGPSFFSPRELDRFAHVARTALALSEEDAFRWQHSIQNGSDAMLKVMLVALCPRLRAVRFIRQYHTQSHLRHPDVELLGKAIRALFESGPDVHWPPGFQSLQRLAVGVRSRAQPQEGDRLHEHILPTETALSFFMLPAARSLYLGDILMNDGQNGDEGVDDLYEWMPGGFSTVEEVFIDSCDIMALIAFEHIIYAPAVLRHFTIQNGWFSWFDCDGILDRAKNNDGVLESLLFYNDGTQELHGYRSNMYDPEYICSPICTLDIRDAVLASGYDYYNRPDSPSEADADRAKLLEFFADGLGISVHTEAIVFVGDLEDLSPTEADLVDEGLAAFIKAQYRISGSLKALYLEKIDLSSAKDSRRCFQRTIRAGRKAGIEVHTKTTRAPEKHTIDFPWPATDKELETSPFYRHPAVDRYRLNPAIGVIQDDCWHCGACERCFEVMPEELWNKKDEDEEDDGSDWDKDDEGDEEEEGAD